MIDDCGGRLHTCEGCGKVTTLILTKYDGKELCYDCAAEPNHFLWNMLSSIKELRRNKELISRVVYESPGEYTLGDRATYYWIVEWKNEKYSLVSCDYSSGYKWKPDTLVFRSSYATIQEIMQGSEQLKIMWYKPGDMFKARR